MTLTRQRSLRCSVPPSSFLNRWRLLTLTQDGCGNSGFEPSSASDHDDGDDGAYAVFGLVQHNRNSRGNLNLNDDEDFVAACRSLLLDVEQARSAGERLYALNRGFWEQRRPHRAVSALLG